MSEIIEATGYAMYRGKPCKFDKVKDSSFGRGAFFWVHFPDEQPPNEIEFSADDLFDTAEDAQRLADLKTEHAKIEGEAWESLIKNRDKRLAHIREKSWKGRREKHQNSKNDGI